MPRKSPESKTTVVKNSGEGSDFTEDEARAAERTFHADHEYDRHMGEAELSEIYDSADAIVSRHDPEREEVVSSIRNDYQGFYKDNDGVAHTVNLRKISTKTRPKKTLSDLIVQPLDVPKPNRRKLKPVKRDHNLLFVVGDAQIGYRRLEDGEVLTLHDEDAMRAAVALAAHVKPDVVIDLGDTTDLAEMSRFGADADHFHGTLGPSLERTQQFYMDLRDATPHAQRRIILDSNHSERWDKYMLKNAPELYNVRVGKTQHSQLSYPGMIGMNDKNFGWDFVGGYGEATFRYNGSMEDFQQPEDEDHYAREDLAFFHGTKSSGRGGTAVWLANHPHNQDRNVVQGHTHKAEMQLHRDRRGKQLGAYVCGALCNLNGNVPSFHSAINEKNRPYRYSENWTNGVMVIRDYGDGDYEFQQVDIQGGVLRYNGETIDARELEQDAKEEAVRAARSTRRRR